NSRAAVITAVKLFGIAHILFAWFPFRKLWGWEVFHRNVRLINRNVFVTACVVLADGLRSHLFPAVLQIFGGEIDILILGAVRQVIRLNSNRFMLCGLWNFFGR